MFRMCWYRSVLKKLENLIDPLLTKTPEIPEIKSFKASLDKVKTDMETVIKLSDVQEGLERDVSRARVKLPNIVRRPDIPEGVRSSLRKTNTMTFSTWRPYTNHNKLIKEGMSEAEVEAIAGKPDKKEFYTATRQRRYIAIAGWYYIMKGYSATQTTLLEFEIGTSRLIRIISR